MKHLTSCSILLLMHLLLHAQVSFAGEIELLPEATCHGKVTLADIAILTGDAQKHADREIDIAQKKKHRLSRLDLLNILKDLNLGMYIVRGSSECQITRQPSPPRTTASLPVQAGRLSSPKSGSAKSSVGANLGLSVFNENMSQTVSIDNTWQTPDITEKIKTTRHSRTAPENLDIATQMKRTLIRQGVVNAMKLDQLDIKSDAIHQPWLTLPFQSQDMSLSLLQQKKGKSNQLTFTLNYLDTNHAYQQINIPVTYSAFINCYQLKRPLERDAIISEADLRASRQMTGHLSGSEVTDLKNIVGMRVKRSKKAGSLILASDIAPLNLVKRYDLVSVYVRNGSLLVKTVGIAQANGTLGQTIRIKNEVNREQFLARVTGSKQVTVTP